jgi:hypothetical protein
MLHHRPRFAGLLIIFAVLVLAPSALAAAPATPAGSAKAKERLYGKHCGAKRTGSGRPAQRAKCVEAMSRLATGRSSSPRAACRALSRKKVSGGRRSAFARCVSAGAKLLRARDRDDSDSDSTADDDEGDEPDDDAADGPSGDEGDGDGDDGGDSGDGDPDDSDAALDRSGAGDVPAHVGLGTVGPGDDPQS